MLQIHYSFVRGEDAGEGAGGRVEIDVIARGADQSRTTVAWYFDGEEEADETFLTIRDGNRALLHNEDAEPAYTVLEAADEHPDELPLESSPLAPASRQFQEACPGAGPSGHRTILGRDAVGYRCTWDDPDPGTPQPEELWLDEVTGLLLEYGDQKAQKVTVNPAVDSTTFSTTPPAGAAVHVVKATGKGAPSPSAVANGQPELSPEDTLRKIAATSPTPVYYLGADFEGVALSEVLVEKNFTAVEATGDHVLGKGEGLVLLYGDNIQLSTLPFQPGHYKNAVGCERIDPLRGVPTVVQADAVWLFTGDLVIRLGGLAYDPDKIAPAGAALFAASSDGPTSANLPAPLAANASLVDRACGAKSGEHGEPVEN